MIGYGNSMFLATHGILARTASGGGVDPDAQAFITAASITDPTQQSAINQLVVDLKGYNIWSKFSALYPMVGGTNSKHSWNLKNTAQYQISWQGGVTSSANGVQFNGTNSYGITGYNPSTNGSLNSHHFSFYSRTQSNGVEVDFGVTSAFSAVSLLEIRTSGVTYAAVNSSSVYTTFSDSDSRAFYIANRTASNVLNIWRNSTKAATGTTASNTLPNGNHWIGAWNNIANPALLYYSTKQCAFASIGDGLTDTEAANFYTAVQAFQTTLGRSIGTQTVSDADAQAFVTNAGIVDQVEANAINNLVIGLKADGLWSKIYAAYPMVGGTSTTTSYNLRNTAQYQISWNGGLTFNQNGVTPNGVNGFGNTGFNPVTVGITKTNFGVSAYSRTNIVENGSLIGLISAAPSYIDLRPRRASNIDVLACYDDTFGYGDYLTNSLGLFTAVRTGTTQKYYQGATEKSQRTGFAATADLNGNIYIGARNFIGNPTDSYSTKQTAWVAFHEFFDATQQTNYSNRIQTFQTALARQV